MDALVFPRKEARYVAAMAMGRFKPGAGATYGPLTLTTMPPPALPGEGWQRVATRLSGICGSDLATVDGKSSRYFEPLVSFPFVPGHEVVGTTEDGRRVILEPVLGPEPHGEVPAWPGAAQADGDDYGHLLGSNLEAGLQIGSCASTGGGWSDQFVAHHTQLHDVADDLSDEAAVMIEPTAAGIHAALKANVPDGGTAVVIGAGTMGLTAIAALRHLTGVNAIIVGARYPHQRTYAEAFGADLVVDPSELPRAVRRVSGARVIGSTLSTGADVVIDAVGSSSSLTDALSLTRPRGRIVMLGMPADVEINLTALWHRETELVGAYCYGTENVQHGDSDTCHTFDLATDLVRNLSLERLVTATYPLSNYKKAIEHAAQAGMRGAIKIAFDLRDETS
jgi:threonine dehydrogenase-like Zn-dependent dehydrogenase